MSDDIVKVMRGLFSSSTMKRQIRSILLEFSHDFKGEIMTFDFIISTEKENLILFSFNGFIDAVDRIDRV